VNNLTVADAEVLGRGSVGCLAGQSMNSTIENCHATGSSTTTVKNAGGLIGLSSDTTNITQCSFIGDIKGIYGCGGLDGYTQNTTIQACFTGGTVTQSEAHRFSMLGGIVGSLTTNSSVRNSYSTASVISSIYCGGLIGSIHSSYVRNSYASGQVLGDENAGAFIGRSTASYTFNCYIDKTLNPSLPGIAVNDTVNNEIGALSTEELSVESSFNSWSFWPTPTMGVPWVLAGQKQPVLFWQLAQAVTDKPDSLLFKGHVISNGLELSEVGFILTFFNRTQLETIYMADSINNDFQIDFTDTVFDGRLMYMQAYAKVTSGLISKGEKFSAPDYTPNTYGGGNGSTEQPFLLYTLDHLRILSETPEDWSYYYKLMANIDASDTRNWNVGDHDDNPETPVQPLGFIPIEAFQGNLDGQGHTIANLYIHNSGFAGLIARGNRINISNLFLSQCDITGGGREIAFKDLKVFPCIHHHVQL
jgi:hypothetical protein